MYYVHVSYVFPDGYGVNDIVEHDEDVVNDF